MNIDCATVIMEFAAFTKMEIFVLERINYARTHTREDRIYQGRNFVDFQVISDDPAVADVDGHVDFNSNGGRIWSISFYRDHNDEQGIAIDDYDREVPGALDDYSHILDVFRQVADFVDGSFDWIVADSPACFWDREPLTVPRREIAQILMSVE